MIAYRIGFAELRGRIDAHKPGWMRRAAQATATLLASGGKAASIWSEVKEVYMRLQGGSKCAYCERKMESLEVGKCEMDVEHFRPKGDVAAWYPSGSTVACAALPGTGKRGYPALAYHLFNCSATCTPCNRTLKRDCFPVAGVYDFAGTDPRALLATEKPLLIYPLGDFDSDPESLITFHGASPQTHPGATGHDRDRALVTIEFFGLDDAGGRRGNLYKERAVVILVLYPQLEKLSDPAASARAAAARGGSSMGSSARTPGMRRAPAAL